MKNNIYVTKSFLPPINEYEEYLKKIWAGQLTNQGPLVREFEKKTSDYLKLGDNRFHFVANGTLALQIALNVLGITEGEVITTPFSYVATTSAILWERCKPVFVDIDPNDYCIDADKIEASITHDTKAILAVHVFGNPCNVEKIDSIAKKHNLKVIYDGAHAFGVKYKGKSLLSNGDISICSFHATKLFHTVEGGCVIPNTKKISDKVELIKRFGHDGDDHKALGINAKVSEFHAAMGLCNLRYIDEIIKKRKVICDLYDTLLKDYFNTIHSYNNKNIEYNYSYYPIVFKNQTQLEKTIIKLNREGIFPRRYFYPSLNTLPYLATNKSCPVSENIAERIICLPLYDTISVDDVHRICKILTD